MITPEDVVVRHAVEVVKTLTNVEMEKRGKTWKLYFGAVKLLTKVFKEYTKEIDPNERKS